ncbi:MAG: ATP-dependent DNA helicase RecG [Clostridiales bacterium]|jgi:ATP-dependent DNA helicase RecG|nr:ATP-dependent DNA helicase RecG [Clostridiales bacterium]
MRLTDIKGIGNAYREKLNLLGVFSVDDLANFLPSGYIDFRSHTKTDEIGAGRYIFVKAEVEKTEFNPRKRVVKAVLKVVSGEGDKRVVLSAFWFNRPYIKDKIKTGEYNFFGKAADLDGKLALTNPVFESADEPKALTGIMPIYRTKGLIPQGAMRKFLRTALEFCRFEGISEYAERDNAIDTAYKTESLLSGAGKENTEKNIAASEACGNDTGKENTEKNIAASEAYENDTGKENTEKNITASEAYGKIKSLSDTGKENSETKMTLDEAYKKAHFPRDIDEAYSAQRRLAFEDFVKLIFTYKLLKEAKEPRNGGKQASTDVMKDYFAALPFSLTDSQKTAIGEILSDMTSRTYMNRILMGDVGSGKTAVAFAAAYFAAKSGMQTAFLAPTELLARQHYKTASEIFAPLRLSVKFLAASCAPAEKKDALRALEDGSADIVIGTHSLFSEGVRYKNPGLIIVDEQHKFGVSEKNALKEKSRAADVLTMSATPIPRALSLALLGELDVSTIERRSKIDEIIATRIVPAKKRNDMFEYIRKQAAAGGQAYIVAARIEDAEGIETDTVKALYKELKEGIFKDVNAALLHGKTEKAEKERIMNGFQSGEIKVLISTTVIEVGIDVKNANVMAVMNADRYGLATLHQLRGRVGRGSEKAYCFLHTARDGCERLRVLTEFSDGFRVAEKDFELRGGGNFLGERQSGGFEVLNDYIIEIDKELIAAAKKTAERIPLNGETEKAFRRMNYQKYYNIIKNTVPM